MTVFARARSAVIALACLASLLMPGVASAAYVTSFGVMNGFAEPMAWSYGDADSTYQEWDNKVDPGDAPIGITPDDPRAGDGLTLFNPNGTPTHGANPPIFGTGMPPNFEYGAVASSTNNFYMLDTMPPIPPDPPRAEFSGGTAVIPNYGVGGPGEGTFVRIQTGGTIDGDITTGIGNVLSSMELLTTGGGAITGGDNASAEITVTNYDDIPVDNDNPDAPDFVDYQEVLYEFFLPGYFDDFELTWDQTWHTTIDTLRVDTFIGAQQTGGLPEPGTALALLGLVGLAGLGRRRRNQRS